MTLRDPGAPRRNPLFAVDATPAVDGPDPAADDGTGAHDRRADDGWGDDELLGARRDPLSGAPGSTVGPLLGALHEAGPEAAEHLVNAAHELTLAVKVVVDAFERTLAEQRAAFAAEHRATEVDLEDAGIDEIDLEDPLTVDRSGSVPRPPVHEPPARAARVQNIDIE